MNNTSVVEGRWVSKERLIQHEDHCLLCGANYGIARGEPRACRTTVCLACGSIQCMINGLAWGTCSICYIGLLSGWSDNGARKCQYKRCGNKAIAYCDGLHKFRCKDHLERGKWQGYVARQLQDRSRNWLWSGSATVPFL